MISIIIPCYNEELILRDSLEKLVEVLENVRFNYEIIFADDCSTDRTAEVIRQLIKEYPGRTIKTVFHKKNEGRGKTVADGIIASHS